MFPRILQQRLHSSKKSVLLLGPRQCGKSTLVRSCEPDLLINLARLRGSLSSFAFHPNPKRSKTPSRRKSKLVDGVPVLPWHEALEELGISGDA